MRQHDEVAGADGQQSFAIVPGGIAYSEPFSIAGTAGQSYTTQASPGSVIDPASGFRVEYTNFGVGDQNTNALPRTAAAYWHAWAGGPALYSDNNWEDHSNARWARLVFDDTGHTSSGRIQWAMCLRMFP